MGTPMPSVSVSVPPWATWTSSQRHEEQQRARRCCIDELASWLAAHVPVLKALAVLNATMPATIVFTARDSKAHTCWRLLRRFFACVDAWLRGASQVVIINNPVSGIFITAALFVPSATVAVYGMLGLTGATAAAMILKLDAQALASGIFGYNGLLVGMALATFLSLDDDWDAPVAAACVVMGGLSTLIQLALGNALVPTFRSPPFTLAFNATFLAFLLASSHWSHFRMPHQAPSPEPMVDDVLAPAEAAANVNVDVGWLLRASLISVGQIFLCESPASGALILAGMAVSSRIAALAAFVGPVLGNALALALGADRGAIGRGLWGYNSSLTCVATLTFFALSSRGCAMAVLGIVLTVLLDGALRSALAPLHMPIGTLPFCVASFTLMLTHSKVPGFEAIPLSDVATAEDHLYAARVGRIADVSIQGDEGGRAPVQQPGASAKDRSASRLAMESVPEGPPASSPVVREALIVSRPGTRETSVHAGHQLQDLGSAPSSVHASQPILKTLHGGSQHGEQHIARKLAAMSTNSGHGGRALELAFRAASAIGISPSVSREGTYHGADHFAAMEALIIEPNQSNIAAPMEPGLEATDDRDVCVAVQD